MALFLCLSLFSLLSYIILNVRFWMSLGTVVLAETLVWSLASWGAALRAEQFKKTVSTFMGLAVVAVMYQALTMLYVVLLWFMQTERCLDNEERLQMLVIQDIRSILSELNLQLKG